MPQLSFDTSSPVIAKVTLPHVSILNGDRPPAAAKATKAKPVADAAAPAKLILVGLDDQGKPHAAWFDAAQADGAVLAADMMDMGAIDVAGDALVAIAGTLPKGKLFESGKAFVPFTKRAVYDQLAAYLDEEFHASAAVRIEAAKAAAAESYAKASKGETSNRLPDDWSKLEVGDLLLATADPDDGWWACIIIAVLHDGRYHLRWRDFPEEGNFYRTVTDLALCHPQYKGA